MKNKGFTLIELLVVIVILAIIALIATPIILNIIDDAKKESDERSVELYADAIKNGIATHQLRTGSEVPAGKYISSEGGKKLTLEEDEEVTFKVEYDGDVVCTTTKIYEDGTIYLEGCTVNGGTEKYSNGTKQQVYKPQYYSWSGGWIEGDLPSDATETASELERTFYLGLDVGSNNKATSAYVCFAIKGTEYCLKGYDTSEGVYETNKAIMEEAFGKSACDLLGDTFLCYADTLRVYAYPYGKVYAQVGATECSVSDDGNFACR